jgi:hypothetical protein
MHTQRNRATLSPTLSRTLSPPNRTQLTPSLSNLNRAFSPGNASACLRGNVCEWARTPTNANFKVSSLFTGSLTISYGSVYGYDLNNLQ